MKRLARHKQNRFYSGTTLHGKASRLTLEGGGVSSKCFIAAQLFPEDGPRNVAAPRPECGCIKSNSSFLSGRIAKNTFHRSGPGYFGVGYDELKIMAFKTDKIIAVVEPLVTSNTY